MVSCAHMLWFRDSLPLYAIVRGQGHVDVADGADDGDSEILVMNDGDSDDDDDDDV
jgi:hypothetical protein